MDAILSFNNQYAQQLENYTAKFESGTKAKETNFVSVISTATYEQSTILDLVQTNNKILNKITQVFASLNKELDYLTEEGSSKFYAPLSLFGALLTNQSEPQEGQAQVWMGKLWPLLSSLSHYVNRVYLVVTNLIRQMASLYHEHQRLYQQTYAKVHLATVYMKLGRIFHVLITLDGIVQDNESLQQCWGMYKRYVMISGG